MLLHAGVCLGLKLLLRLEGVQEIREVVPIQDCFPRGKAKRQLQVPLPQMFLPFFISSGWRKERREQHEYLLQASI